MTPEEHEELARIAHGHLDDGYWEGCATPNGGWEDEDRGFEWGSEWHGVARDFHTRWEAGDRNLTEGMLRYASYDICRELAWRRGWCPGFS
jgi:hypothetical protein